MFAFIRSLLDKHDNALKEEIAFLKSQLNRECKSCETLKAQLEFANAEKVELMETLIQLTRPNVVIPQGEVKELKQVPNANGLFSRRRAILENMSKKREEISKTSPFVANVSDLPRATVKDITPQSVDALERELGVVDEHGEKQNAS